MTRCCSSCSKEIEESIKFCPSSGKTSEMPSPVKPQATPLEPVLKFLFMILTVEVLQVV